HLFSIFIHMREILRSDRRQNETTKNPRFVRNGGSLLCSNGQSGGAPASRRLRAPVDRHQRFENWGARRAALSPYFFRSFIRGSRVRRPAFFRIGRYSGSTFRSARAMPWRMAPACPLKPPPLAFTSTSYLPSVSVSTSG